jgi:hypothetical protein
VLRSFLLSVVLLAACDASDRTPAAQSASTTESCLCFAGIGSSEGDVPVLELNVEGEVRLIVCGTAVTAVEHSKVTMSEFDVFACDSGASVIRYGAADIGEVALEGSELHITKLGRLPSGKNWQWQQVPLFRQTVSAAGSSPHVTAPESVFKAPALDQASFEALDSELAMMKASKATAIDDWEDFFGKLLVCSQAGHRSCIAALKDPEGVLGIGLDGAAAESHREAIALFSAIGGKLDNDIHAQSR